MLTKIGFLFLREEDFLIYKKENILKSLAKHYAIEAFLLYKIFPKKILEKPANGQQRTLGFLNSSLVAPIFFYHLFSHIRNKIWRKHDNVDKAVVEKAQKFCKMIKTNRIHKVVVISNYFFQFEQEIIKELKRNNIETILIENGWDRICCKMAFSITPDKIGLFSRTAENAVKRFVFFRPKKTKTVGHPYFFRCARPCTCQKKSANKVLGFFGMTKPANEFKWLDKIVMSGAALGLPTIS